jgi:hypothetical protein
VPFPSNCPSIPSLCAADKKLVDRRGSSAALCRSSDRPLLGALKSARHKIVIAHFNRSSEDCDVNKWKDSTTVGVLGCFLVSLGLLLLAGWIVWQIMELNIPG